MKNSIVKIESISNKSFGTGFVIDSDENGVYILTCQHIVDDVATPIVVEKVLAEVIAQDSFVDMAILYVSKLDLEPLSLQKERCNKLEVDIIGFSHFNQDMTQKKYISATLYTEAVELHSNENSKYFNVHKIKTDDGFRLERGNSGSPVICKKTKNVIAMISNKEGSNIGYAIDIEQLKNIWKEMPKDLLEGKKIEKNRLTEEIKTLSNASKIGFNFNYLLFLGFFLSGIFVTNAVNNMEFSSLNKEEVEKETSLQTKSQKYKNLLFTLKNIQKNDNEISMAVVIQNNGDKSASIQHEYRPSNTYLTDENGKRWNLTQIFSMENEYNSPTQILNDGRRIISEHIFTAVDDTNGKDFYLRLKYFIDGKWVLLGFDHIKILNKK